jgi:hypothetical protein
VNQITAFYQEVNQLKMNNYAGLKAAMQVYVFIRDHAAFIMNAYSEQMDDNPIYSELKAFQGYSSSSSYIY